jgi:glycosyltransferase involved in cell wall biosynthesis
MADGHADAAPPASAPWAGCRVVLVHDWLTGMRGGEKVLEAICRIVPQAELVTLLHVPGSVSPLIAGRRIRTSFIQHLPLARHLYRHYLPLFPIAVEALDLDDADLVISTSHAAVKSVVRTGRARHLCYCHSPMRYAWDQFEAYFGVERVGPVPHAVLRRVMAGLARWDRATADRVDAYLANSRYVAGRIARYYNRHASVLYPPVDTSFFTPGGVPPEFYYLVVSALVPYKRIDVAIQAASLLGARLKIAGIGPDEARLKALAGPTVEFLGSVEGEGLRELYRRAQALVLPAEEDFGIAPVEAMACGRPVVALARGGATESVEPGITGMLVDRQTPEAFAEAMRAAATATWTPARLVERASLFGPDRFDRGFRQALGDLVTASPPC